MASIIDLRRQFSSIYPGNVVRPSRWVLLSKQLFVVSLVHADCPKRRFRGAVSYLTDYYARIPIV